MARILVVDDEPSHRDSLRRIFERAGHDVVTADDGEQALAVLREQSVHILLTDLVMPRMDGLTLLKSAKAVQPETDVVVMTAYGTVENAVAAMRDGAYDFVVKPAKRGELLACVDRILERQALLVENRSLRAALAETHGIEGIVGQSAVMRDLQATIRQVAPSSATVLLLGESGTGKELVARAIHNLSPRASGPFVAVSCAAIPESILEAELFGAEKGAFTGAAERRLGRFERAHGGTLLLDEIGDLPLTMQVKLLRALQQGEIERLGGQEAITVDVRVVAATHVDLQERVKQGLFREDLFYRLDVVSLVVPPLRVRAGDVPLLAMQFVKRLAHKHKKNVQHIDARAMDALSAWSFPGNVRELENAIERAVVMCPGDTVRLEDLPRSLHDSDGKGGSSGELSLAFRVGTTLEQLERAAIDLTMKHTGGDKQLTAKILGVSIRTLYRRLGMRDDGSVGE